MRTAFAMTSGSPVTTLLLGSADPADHARAIALGNEALVIGREFGMRPLIERVLARRVFLRA